MNEGTITLNIGEGFMQEQMTFRLTDCIPTKAYSIWNIGENMPDGYLPLGRRSEMQPYPGGGNIDTDSLFAIKTEGAQKILAVTRSGVNSLSAMEAYLEENADAKPDTYEYVLCGRIREALPYMKSIKNIEFLEG